MKREDLFQEIFNQLGQWTELDRRIFSLVHYQGQSLEAISSAFEMDLREVRRILKKCDRQLQISLRKYREDDCPNSAISTSGIACLTIS
jgi:DNA-directed RNA polymerase specialized sigma24 family protein